MKMEAKQQKFLTKNKKKFFLNGFFSHLKYA